MTRIPTPFWWSNQYHYPKITLYTGPRSEDPKEDLEWIAEHIGPDILRPDGLHFDAVILIHDAPDGKPIARLPISASMVWSCYPDLLEPIEDGLAPRDTDTL